MSAPTRTAPQGHCGGLDPGFLMSSSVFHVRTKAESLFCEKFTPLQCSLSFRMDSKVTREGIETDLVGGAAGSCGGRGGFFMGSWWQGTLLCKLWLGSQPWGSKTGA